MKALLSTVNIWIYLFPTTYSLVSASDLQPQRKNYFHPIYLSTEMNKPSSIFTKSQMHMAKLIQKHFSSSNFSSLWKYNQIQEVYDSLETSDILLHEREQGKNALAGDRNQFQVGLVIKSTYFSFQRTGKLKIKLVQSCITWIQRSHMLS